MHYTHLQVMHSTMIGIDKGSEHMLNPEELPTLCIWYACTRLQVVHNTMMEFDKDGDNMLNPEEFRLLLNATDLQNTFAMAM